MIFSKINIYLFTQICKYFLLILFIFLSVAWLLQVTRLFTISNFVNIKIFEILFLSLYLIPNIITIITPFILIFSLLLCFIKLYKDNELISILSIGDGLKPFNNTLLFFSFIIIILFSILNFYLAPKVYEIYKNKEFELRNTFDFNNMTFSNFLNLNKKTILDFNKKDEGYEDIFISFEDENENIIYAKSGNIFSENNNYNFQLTDGFKISIDQNKQIEKLEFYNYVLKIENNRNINGNIIDNNTFTIFDDFNSKNYLNLTFKFVDIFLIIFIVIFFYFNNLIKIKFSTVNNIYFLSICVSVLILNQILRNAEIFLFNYIIFIFSIICISLIILILKLKYEKN